MTKEQFKKFAKEEFGYDISFEKSDEPDTYESLFGSCKGCEHAPTTYIDAIMDGVELPKGHGDLIDKSELTTVTEIRPDGSEITYVPYSEIEEANVIVKADKENADERNSD